MGCHSSVLMFDVAAIPHCRVDILACLNVIHTTKQDVNMLKTHTLPFRDKEIDHDAEENIDAHKEVESVEITISKEGRECLPQDDTGKLLHLGRDRDTIRPNNLELVAKPSESHQ